MLQEQRARPKTEFKDVFRDLRVLDFCWVGAGSLVTKFLADLGAQVIKVESRRRPDNLRTSPPFKDDEEGLERSGYFGSRNTSKLSFALDMKHPRAFEVARDLVAACDVVTNNFRPGVMERWGLAYEAVREINPASIYLSMPMQGNDGPHRDYIGFGSTILAVSGITEPSGLPDRLPTGTGTQYPDHVPNPCHALIGLLAALVWRDATGEGQEVELSQLESTVNLAGPWIIAAGLGDPPPPRTGNRTTGACPSGVFPCSGAGCWCTIEVRTDREWQALATALGDPAWMADVRFATAGGRKEHEDFIERALGETTRQWDKWRLMLRLQEQGVAAGVVESSRDLLEDEQLRERGYWHFPPHEALGPMAVNRTPFRADGDSIPPLGAAPQLGEHTRSLAVELLGYEEQRYEDLVADGVFR